MEKNTNYYISDNYKKITNKNKYLQSRINLLNKKIKKSLEIEYLDEENMISFINGRHRFSNSRDLECKEIRNVKRFGM